MYTHNQPEDSVLRRHYEQLRNSENQASSRKRASQSAPQPAASSSVTGAQSTKQGFSGWLHRLFGN